MSKVNKCINCGEIGSHFVHPSLGEEGFFLCNKKGTPCTWTEEELDDMREELKEIERLGMKSEIRTAGKLTVIALLLMCCFWTAFLLW